MRFVWLMLTGFGSSFSSCESVWPSNYTANHLTQPSYNDVALALSSVSSKVADNHQSLTHPSSIFNPLRHPLLPHSNVHLLPETMNANHNLFLRINATPYPASDPLFPARRHLADKMADNFVMPAVLEKSETDVRAQDQPAKQSSTVWRPYWMSEWLSDLNDAIL